jgi:hypothetical protein
MKNIEINPQQVMMITEQMLEGGWIKGQERGGAGPYASGDQDPSGVCIAGALREALTVCLRNPVHEMLTELPEYIELPARTQKEFERQVVHQHVQRLHDIFRVRIEKVLNHRIESWNDASSRKKKQVLEAMRASLEIITQECLEAWQQDEPALRADPEYVFVGTLKR